MSPPCQVHVRRTRRASLATRVFAALAVVLSAGCAELPWGSGGLEVAPAQRSAFVRVLAQSDLTLASGRLDNELLERVGTSMRLVEGAVTPVPGVEVSLVGASIVLGPATLSASYEGDRLLARLELSAPPQPLSTSISDCSATFALTPGVLELVVELTSDRLGRVQGIVKPGARWVGDSPTVALEGCVFPAQSTFDFGARFATAAAQALADPIAVALPSALGLDLALAWSGVVGLDTLGAGIVRASLRATADGVLSFEGDLAMVHFDLGLEVDPHPCAGGLALPEARPALVSPTLAGTAVALGALERAVQATWIAGAVCGASAIALIPESLRSVPLSDLAQDWPAVANLARLDPAATVTLAFWPGDLPTVEADPDDPDILRVTIHDLQVDVLAQVEGAQWRLASVDLDLLVRGQIVTDINGFVHFDAIDVDATSFSSTTGLATAPELAKSGPLLTPIMRLLVESRPLLRLPRSLAPSVTTVWRVDGDHLTLPSAKPSAL